MASQKEIEIYRAAIQIFTAGLTPVESLNLAVQMWDATRDKLYRHAKDSLKDIDEKKVAVAGGAK